MTQTVNDLKKRADELANAWVLVGTNEGTYGPGDIARTTRDGEHATWKCYDQVGTGKRTWTGPKMEDAPGYARWFRTELATKQAELRRLREQIKQAEGR